MASKTRLPKEESSYNRAYNLAVERPVDEKAFFLEAGQGKNVNGNVFALLDHIRHCPEYDDYSVALSLLPEKFEEARVKLEKYGIDDVRFIAFGGKEYRDALGTAKYLVTDNSFPAYFFKRPEQVYLNTWHGTPLKALGRTDIDNAISIANVQANMAKADWLLFPNEFTKDIMLKDYMMEKVFKHKTVIMDYPRNDALYKNRFTEEIKERYGLKGKRAIAYMPTWRGTGRDADTDLQAEETLAAIKDIVKGMRSDDVLFINLHFLINQGIDLSGLDRVHQFPTEYETYDFLAACDALITDYSSVSIDFAGTGKEIILYLYDYERYKKDKGFYWDVKDLPFKTASTAEELEKMLQSDPKAYELDGSLMSADRGSSSERILKLIANSLDADDETAGPMPPEVEDYSLKGRAGAIHYFDNIRRDDSRDTIRQLEKECEDGHSSAPVIMFQNALDEEALDVLRSLDGRTDFVRITGHFYCSNMELRLLQLYKKFGIFSRRAEDIYQREYMRQAGQFGFERFVIEQCRNRDRLNMFRCVPESNGEGRSDER